MDCLRCAESKDANQRLPRLSYGWHPFPSSFAASAWGKIVSDDFWGPREWCSPGAETGGVGILCPFGAGFAQRKQSIRADGLACVRGKMNSTQRRSLDVSGTTSTHTGREGGVAGTATLGTL